MAFYGDETGTVQVGALTGSTSNDLYRMCIPLMVLTTLAVTLRVYVRGYMTKTFSVEDWLIVPAYVGCLFLLHNILLNALGLVYGHVYMCDRHGAMAVGRQFYGTP